MFHSVLAFYWFVLSQRREKELRKQGFYFVGSGVSGGEEGARHGPSLMPGGSIEAWSDCKMFFLWGSIFTTEFLCAMMHDVSFYAC
jgi:6-phosphogluconate dehydrogenase